MSTLKVNALNNGGSAIDFPSSFKLGGNPIEQGYTSSATEPTSPNTGDLWWDSTNEALYQYLNGEFKAITTVGAWSPSLSDFSYDSVSVSLNNATYGDLVSPRGMAWNDDGTKLFIQTEGGNKIVRFSLSTAYDITTMSLDTGSYATTGAEANHEDMAFNGDGTRVYTIGTSTDKIYFQDLSTAYDITSATGSLQHKAGQAALDGVMTCLKFNLDGTKLFMSGRANDRIYEMSLTTAYDVTTFDNTNYQYVSCTQANPEGFKFNDDGTRIFYVGTQTDAMGSFTLTTPFDLTTATEDSETFSVSSQDVNPKDILFTADGTKMILVGDTNDTLYQYSTGL